MKYYGIHQKVISQEILKIPILDMSLKMTNSWSQPHVPGANELNMVNVMSGEIWRRHGTQRMKWNCNAGFQASFFFYWVWLTHHGLGMPCCYIDLGQYWLRWWLDAWRHQAINSTNVDLSLVSSNVNHPKAISYEVLMGLIWNICHEITLLNLPHSPAANGLNWAGTPCDYKRMNEWNVL